MKPSSRGPKARGISCLAFLFLCLPAAAQDCWEDAAALAHEAESILADAGARLPAAALERARHLYRRARYLSPSPALSLRAADLAAAAGDDEESGDLLSEAAEMNAGAISPAERLILARRAEARRRWRDAIAHYQALRSALAADSAAAGWVDSKVRRLEIESEAQAISSPVVAPPPPEARLALAQARQALSSGDPARARERLRLALKLSPGYAEAALALAALETRVGRIPEAIRAYREALSSDLSRFEALVGLANVLWDEPDRAAKEESLALLDRALAARPDAISLLKVSALRRAEWGDATAALERLDAYRRRAGAAEKRATEDLRETLARRVDDLLSGRGGASEEPALPELSSPAIDQWKVAQAYVRRGDTASLASALEHLSEAERLDPAFARAPELAGTIHERRGELARAEAAYERAILADPARAATYERLALLLARQPGRESESEEAWRRAEQAGSPEALFHLGKAAIRAGRRGEALSLYRRYLAESPGGVHTEEVSRSIGRLEARRRLAGAAAVAGLGLALLAGGVFAYRRLAGRTFEEWLRAEPGRAREARPIVGRLRHEVLKHGGLLLSDAAKKLAEPDPVARRETARLLAARLYGSSDSGGRGGLLSESYEALSGLKTLAREDGFRLNLESKDPLFSPITRAAGIVSSIAGVLSRVAARAEDVPERTVRRIVERLERTGRTLQSTSGAAMFRLLDEVSSTRARPAELRNVLARVCAEKGLAPPPELEWRGEEVAVRVDPADWETIWRNLFANALDAAGELPVSDVKLGVFAELRRDPVTGAPAARFVLADNVPRPLTTEMIRGRAADRGWGVVADTIRRHEGTADVGPPPGPRYCKGIVLEIPALEPEAPA